MRCRPHRLDVRAGGAGQDGSGHYRGRGGTITARTVNGPLTIVLTPSTKITQTSGIAKREARPVKSLIPGLIFTVNGDQQGQVVTAEDIRFKERDWRTAIATKAGTVEQFSELRQAIIDGNEYVIRDEATVYFPSGSAVVGESYKQALQALATEGAVVRQLSDLDPRIRRPTGGRRGQ